MNDRERREWVMNDEFLYNWFLGQKLRLHQFIRIHRKEIDIHITWVLHRHDKPA